MRESPELDSHTVRSLGILAEQPKRSLNAPRLTQRRHRHATRFMAVVNVHWDASRTGGVAVSSLQWGRAPGRAGNHARRPCVPCTSASTCSWGFVPSQTSCVVAREPSTCSFRLTSSIDRVGRGWRPTSARADTTCWSIEFGRPSCTRRRRKRHSRVVGPAKRHRVRQRRGQEQYARCIQATFDLSRSRSSNRPPSRD
jgi:hypothetical protein